MPIPNDWECKHRNGLEVLMDGAGTYWLTCANPDCRQVLKAITEKEAMKLKEN